MTRLSLLFLAFLAAAIPTTLPAQDKKIEFPAASQHALVKQRIGLTDFEIDYSRPNKNKREIFGGLVPFYQIWRTGANSPTRIKFSDAVTINGKPVKAGEYILLSIPGEKQWNILLSKDLKMQSTADYSPANDAVKIATAPQTVSSAVETFTIGFDDLRTDSATLFLEWDTTRVAIPVTTNTVETVTQQIDGALKSGKEQDPGFYFNAAIFYLDQNKDLAQAAKWIDHAIEKNPKAPPIMFYRKAQILAKLGNKADAIAAAEKSDELLKAQPKPDESALRNNRVLIESLR